jgi:hypothetical protein
MSDDLKNVREDIAASPCVGSGMCCRRPCGYGEWNDERTACAFLAVAHAGAECTVYRCERYEHIARQPGAWFSPAFGAGCCQPLFNLARERTLRALRDGADADAAGTLGASIVERALGHAPTQGPPRERAW